LQKDVRAQGNTELLDDELVPFPGEQQWEVLAAIRRIDPATVERIVADASRNDRVLGIRASENGDDETPWFVKPSSKRKHARVDGPLPQRVSAVLAQRLFVDIA